MTFKALAIHRVGNKLREEGVLTNEDLYQISDAEFKQCLLDYFLPPFKSDEYFRFNPDISNIDKNIMRECCNAIFDDRKTLYDHSITIARHLYKQSTHPKIQSGELYITYFADCVVDDELVDCIGIFKSENKYVYLKPTETDSKLHLKQEKGINVKKLDKGCLVFNTYKEDGYRVLIVDKQSRTDTEAKYWRSDFLDLNRVHDNSFNTQNYMSMCKEFCEDVFAEENNRKDEVLLLNKSLNYFTDHDAFDLEEFATEVIENPKHISAFKEFKNEYELNNGFVSHNDFKISRPMVKTMKRQFSKVIELDTGIEVKLTTESTEQYIERGYDDQRKMFYYKVYFQEEH